MVEFKDLNDVTAGWQSLKGIDNRNLPMNSAPITRKVYQRSRNKFSKLNLKNDETQSLKDQYHRIGQQLKIAGNRKFIYSKIALFGILIVIVLAALRYHEAGKEVVRLTDYTQEQKLKRFDQQKQFLEQQIEKYNAQITSGKDGIKRRNRKLRKDPEKLDRYWTAIHKIVENDEKELQRLGEMSIEDYFQELMGKRKSYRTEKFWQLLGYIAVIPIYFLSRFTPNYLLWQRRGYSKSWHKILNFIEYIATGSFLVPFIGGIAAADTNSDYIIIKKWSDGSTTRETPDNGGFIKLLLILFLLSLIITLLPVRIIMGVLRNWILYV